MQSYKFLWKITTFGSLTRAWLRLQALCKILAGEVLLDGLLNQSRLLMSGYKYLNRTLSNTVKRYTQLLYYLIKLFYYLTNWLHYEMTQNIITNQKHRVPDNQPITGNTRYANSHSNEKLCTYFTIE